MGRDRDEDGGSCHIPERMCIGCRGRFPKGELLRFVAASGSLEWDERQERAGRGAYVCARRKCVQAARRRGLFVRALRGQAACDAAALWDRVGKHLQAG